LGSSLFSVGEDEIQRNNQEIRKSGKEREECGLSTTEGIAVAHPWILKKRGAEWISGHGLSALSRLAL
jgi:hypothetical protein